MDKKEIDFVKTYGFLMVEKPKQLFYIGDIV